MTLRASVAPPKMNARTEARFARHWPVVEARLAAVYGDHPQFTAFLSRLKSSLALSAQDRPAELCALDEAREAGPGWTAAASGSVYSVYVDRFADDLKGLADHIDYLSELGVAWLHPLPLLKPRDGDSDGGFAVADYRDIDPRLGTMPDLEALVRQTRERGMGVILDVVCNHTAREHDWAIRARAGDPQYKDYYITLPDPASVQAWEADLIDVFPTTAPGSFTWDADMGGYVWTTFYPFQWDLNYANPAVFAEMLDVLIHLAAKGVQGFRLDSAPFLWKRLGTASRNQPQTYAIVEAWRAALNIVAPGVVLLAEAIESLDDVLPFFGQDEASCDLAYNNGVMTALWASLADADAHIFRKVLTEAARKPSRGTWLNYVRCHDDLIWNALARYAAPEDLARWSSFYGEGTGFSHGKAFQSAEGGVASTNGMTASLVGVDRSQPGGGIGTRRLILLYGVVFALDGWPLIYMGDEIALGDDVAYAKDPLRAIDGRWLHRPMMDWTAAAQRHDPAGPEAAAFTALQHFGRLSRQFEAFGIAGPALPVVLEDPALLAFTRDAGSQTLLCLANLSDRPVTLNLPEAFAGQATDLLTDHPAPADPVTLAPYGVHWWVTR